MWTVENYKNKDKMRFDEAALALAVFELMKKEGYYVFLRSPDGTIVNNS